jgi:hypothetical protein
LRWDRSVTWRFSAFAWVAEGRLGVDDDVPVLGQAHDQVGAALAVVGADGLLLDERHVLGQPGQLHRAAQLHLAPVARDAGALQRGGDPHRGLTQLHALAVQLGVLCGDVAQDTLDRGEPLGRLHLGVLQLAGDRLQLLADRGEEGLGVDGGRDGPGGRRGRGPGPAQGEHEDHDDQGDDGGDEGDLHASMMTRGWDAAAGRAPRGRPGARFRLWLPALTRPGP